MAKQAGSGLSMVHPTFTDPGLLERAGRRLAGWRRTMLLSHARPDGDALGALAGMARVIRGQGREATGFVYDDVPARYGSLQKAGKLARWRGADGAAPEDRFDGILVMDTCSWSQLEPVAEVLRATALPRVVIDHHATREELGGETLYAIDRRAASTCGMLHELCEVMGWALDAAAAEALFVGMATDTGWFRFSNTDEATLRSASALVAAGVRPDRMYTRLFEGDTPARLRLKAAMLATLEYHAGDAVAAMSITREMFAGTGATADDTENLINEAMTVEPVVVAVLVSEQEEGPIRVNLRSKSPEVAGRDVDVSALAKRFGGGGHRRAAGARIEGPIEEVRRQVVEAVVEAVANMEVRSEKCARG